MAHARRCFTKPYFVINMLQDVDYKPVRSPAGSTGLLYKGLRGCLLKISLGLNILWKEDLCSCS